MVVVVNAQKHKIPNYSADVADLQCLQAALLSFSINLPIFQYFACIFSIFQYFTKSSIHVHDVCTKFSQFSVFVKFYQYLRSEFSKNTDKSVYLEALDLAYLQWHSPRKPMHHTCEGEQ